MAKATHSGTCQICGRSQKLPKGRLSNHGYTVDWGFFNGTCHGAQGLPFEQSTNLVESMITNVKADIADLQAEILDLQIQTDFVWMRVYYSYKDHPNGKGGYMWEKIPSETIKVTNYSDEHHVHVTFAVMCLKNVGTPYEVAQFDREATTVEAAVVSQNKNYTQELIKRIAQLQSYVEWQQERVANWKPQELTPVA